MVPTPRSLILDLLSTLGRSAAPVGALVAAGRLFGLAEGSLRVALARGLAAGLVERDGRGRYRLAPGAVGAHVRAWRGLERRLRGWSGAWIGVHTAGLPRARAAAQRRRTRALHFLGLRELATGLWVRPDNLAVGVAGIRGQLAELGLGGPAPVLRLTGLCAEDDARARGLWDAEALTAAYRATRARLEASAARLLALPSDAARVESFRVGGAAIRQLVFDPLLPEPLVGADDRRALLESLRDYDRIGRRVWSGWLGEGAEAPGPAPVGVALAASGLGAARG